MITHFSVVESSHHLLCFCYKLTTPIILNSPLNLLHLPFLLWERKRKERVMSHKRSRTSQVIQVFSLNPMPYPVLLILAVILIFLGIQGFVSYESMVESTQESFGWLLMATPVVLVFAVKWLSSIEDPESLFRRNRRRQMNYAGSFEGSFPWGVAAMIVLVLVLLQYQSSFLESWFVWYCLKD